MCHSDLNIEKYKIDASCQEDDVMYYENLLGFSIPITRKVAEMFNHQARETEKWYNNKNSNGNENVSYSKRLLDEICRISKAKKIKIEDA